MDLFSLPHIQPDGIPVEFVEEVLPDLWSDWRGTNLLVSDV